MLKMVILHLESLKQHACYSDASLKMLLNNCIEQQLNIAFSYFDSPERLSQMLKDDFSSYPSAHMLPYSSLSGALKTYGISTLECLLLDVNPEGIHIGKQLEMSTVSFFTETDSFKPSWEADYLLETLDGITCTFLKNIHSHVHNEAVTITKTKHFIIRELGVTDIPALVKMAKKPEISCNLDDLKEPLEAELEKHRAYIKYAYHFDGFGLWGVFDQENQTLAGRCGIQSTTIDDTAEIELGYCMDLPYQHKGYAYECCKAVLEYAFTNLQLDDLIVCIENTNERSIKLAKRLGFEYEKRCIRNQKTCSIYRLLKS